MKKYKKVLDKVMQGCYNTHIRSEKGGDRYDTGRANGKIPCQRAYHTG